MGDFSKDASRKLQKGFEGEKGLQGQLKKGDLILKALSSLRKELQVGSRRGFKGI